MYIESVEIDAVLVETSPLLGPMFLSACLEEHARLGKLQSAIGVKTVNNEKLQSAIGVKTVNNDDTHFLVLDSEILYSSDLNMDTSNDEDSDAGGTDSFNPNIFMVGAMHAQPHKDVDTEHLSKIC